MFVQAVGVGAQQLGVTLVLLAIIELAASLALRAMPRPATFDPAFVSTADAYGGASWAQPHLETLATMRNRWQPYLYWSPEPTTTKFLTIEESGHRRTVHPEIETPTEASVSIAMFGGSTMFGWGARDQSTIPSVVARLAAQHVPGVRVHVTNRGRDGYVSSQEVIQLEALLKAGARPDVVVFYDGINDVETAIALQRAGETYEETTLRASTQSRRHLRRHALMTLVTQSSTVGVMRAALRLRARPTDLETKLLATDLDALADQVVSTYLANVAHVDKLSAAYGFACLFYWQPMLYTKATPTAYEQQLLTRRWFDDGPAVSSEIYQALWLKVYGRVRALSTSGSNVRDVSQIFDADPAPRFIDPQHLAEEGNEVVARRMMDDIEPLIRASAANTDRLERTPSRR